MKSLIRIALAAGLSLALAGPVRAQSSASMTAADVQRLQDSVYDLGGDISRLRTRDASLANRLDEELSDLRDEVIYLKVKLRKESNVSRGEYADLRDRLDALRARARGEVANGPSRTAPPPPPVPQAQDVESPSRSAPPPPPPSSGGSRREHEIPVGQEIDVRLQSPLSSSTAQVEDRFEATTLVDVLEGDRVLIPAGSVMRGVVQAVNKAGRLDRKGSMTLSFDELTVKGRTYPIRATVTQAIESEGVRGEVGKIGAGAGVGAIIGGILGGFKGALAGILIGGGGTIAATEGKDVTLQAGTVLRVRFDSPIALENGSSRR
jgi:CRISPR/Cas system-associated endoribonuclease Cas2